MKKLILFFIIMISIPSVLANWFYNSENIIVNININSYADIITSQNGYVEDATINLTFFPKQTEAQELSNFYTIPKAEAIDKSLIFTWKRPYDKLEFKLNADVKTTNSILKIRDKIRFPIENLPDDVIVYTKPSETIDSDKDSIIRMASELVKGEGDLYAAVFKIADWTKNNINYNLSTLTAEVSQKASWVLQNRQGVCDELTSLFIALLRAVGIPARFVSGISYTNSPLFPEEWGPHGWAEVYFPSYGWVPFDVTYAQFGWIDPTHIKFKDSIDSDEPSTYYQWRGRNADLITKKLDIKTTLLEKRGYVKVPLKLEASTMKQAVSFGSYNLIEATIENLNDYYYSTEFYLIKSKEVKVVGNEIKDILLLPKEKKKLFWILKIQDFLDEKYSYTFPIIVSTLNNITSETSFTASIREKYISFEEIEEIAKLLEEEKEKRYSSNILLDCKTKKIEFFEYEDVSLHCNIKNIGNVFLENIDVCFQDKCQKTSLGISQSNNFTFEINKSYAGQKQSVVTATNELVSKTSYLNLKIKDAPKIEIKDVEFPTNVSYGDNFTVLFTIAKKSNTNPKNVEIIFNQNGIEKKWSIEELTENRKFILRFQGSQLRYRENINSIKVNYNDGLSKYYNVQKDFTIALTNATILQRLYLSPNIFGSVFERIGYRTISLMLLFGAVAFVIVVILVFRGSRKY